MIVATRRYEIDMGHMLPTHLGKCFHAHGHRYVIEADVTTDQGLDRPGAPDDGMVMDFAVIKQVMADVLEQYDHRFLICVADPEYITMTSMVGRGVIAVPYIPTAENLASYWADEIGDELSNHNAELVELRVWETPNACATWRPS